MKEGIKSNITNKENCRIFFSEPKTILCDLCDNRTKCLKNQPCNVIKMMKMRGEVEKKTPKKDMDNP